MARIDMDWSGPEPTAVYKGRMWRPTLQWWEYLSHMKMGSRDSERVRNKTLLIVLHPAQGGDKVLNATEYDMEHEDLPRWAECREVVVLKTGDWPEWMLPVWDNNGIHADSGR